jgi:hypothetical protein
VPARLNTSKQSAGTQRERGLNAFYGVHAVALPTKEERDAEPHRDGAANPGDDSCLGLVHFNGLSERSSFDQGSPAERNHQAPSQDEEQTECCLHLFFFRPT